MDVQWLITGFAIATGLTFYSIRKYTKQKVAEIKKEQQERLSYMADELSKDSPDSIKKELDILSNRLMVGDFEGIRAGWKEKEIFYKKELGSQEIENLKKKARHLYKDEDLYSSYLQILIHKARKEKEKAVQF